MNIFYKEYFLYVFLLYISIIYFYNTSCIRKDCLKNFLIFLTHPFTSIFFYVIVCIESFRYLRVYKKGDLS